MVPKDYQKHTKTIIGQLDGFIAQFVEHHAGIEHKAHRFDSGQMAS